MNDTYQFLDSRSNTKQSAHEDAAVAQILLERRVAQFEEQRATWELNRQQEQSRLHQEGTALIEAWRRLEDEQRRLYAEQQRLCSCVTPASTPVVSSNPSGHEANPPKAPPTRAGNHAATESTTWWQLEQLRLEMQKHASRGAMKS